MENFPFGWLWHQAEVSVLAAFRHTACAARYDGSWETGHSAETTRFRCRPTAVSTDCALGPKMSETAELLSSAEWRPTLQV